MDQDPAPDVEVGDFVQSKTKIDDEGDSVAEKGDVGRVIVKHCDPEFGWCLPTVRFERTGRIYDVFPEEIDVLAEKDFATTEATTPKKPRRTAIKRGAT